ncbi:MAG: hypothetical protein V7K38_19300 [Nostoc sp.]
MARLDSISWNSVPEIIANFRNQGYHFVTIPELLQIQDKNEKLIRNKK